MRHSLDIWQQISVWFYNGRWIHPESTFEIIRKCNNPRKPKTAFHSVWKSLRSLILFSYALCLSFNTSSFLTNLKRWRNVVLFDNPESCHYKVKLLPCCATLMSNERRKMAQKLFEKSSIIIRSASSSSSTLTLASSCIFKKHNHEFRWSWR